VSLWRLRSLMCLAVATLVLGGGCGGDGGEAPKKTAPSTPPAKPQPSPPPTFSDDHIRASLLPPKDVAADVKPQAPTYPGLTSAEAPACSVSSVRLPGKPKTMGRQLGNSKKNYTGAHLIQLIAVYPDAEEAADALTKVRAKAKACPAKRHFPAKRTSEKKFTIAHTDTWTFTEDSVAGWTHIRGFEKRQEPPSSSIYNVFYSAYDYASRGNVVVTSLYWERAKPTTPGKRIADKATKVLTKQLQKIG
jgi:hypothetical protein